MVKTKKPGKKTRLPRENHSTKKNPEKQEIPQYQVKTTVPGENQRTREYHNIR